MQRKAAAAHRIHPSCNPLSRCAQPACPTRRLRSFAWGSQPRVHWCTHSSGVMGVSAAWDWWAPTSPARCHPPVSKTFPSTSTWSSLAQASLSSCSASSSAVILSANSGTRHRANDTDIKRWCLKVMPRSYSYMGRPVQSVWKTSRGRMSRVCSLSCQHTFHRKCLVKWLEVRYVCLMCNKPIAGPSEATQSIGILLDEPVWVLPPYQGLENISSLMGAWSFRKAAANKTVGWW